MANSKKRRLDSVVSAIQGRHGTRALRKGSTATHDRPPLPPYISTSFPALDKITGCRGIPLNSMILLTGQSTSGKLTLAYKILANAQHSSGRGRHKGGAARSVAIVDLNQTSDPDYLHRCGVDLDQLIVAYPRPNAEAIHLLFDLIQQQALTGKGPRLILIDGLSNLARAYRAIRALDKKAKLLLRALDEGGCALLFVDEPAPPWQRWFNLDSSRTIRHHAALHIELRHEQWLYRSHPVAGGQLTGYQAVAKIRKSKWTSAGETASISVEFNGTVKARETY